MGGRHPKCIEVKIIIVYVKRACPVIYVLDGYYIKQQTGMMAI